MQQKESKRPNVFFSLFHKYTYNREGFRVVSYNEDEAIFQFRRELFYFDLINTRAKPSNTVSQLDRETKQIMELLTEELYSKLHEGWSIARGRRARDRYLEDLDFARINPELIPEITPAPPPINWNLQTDLCVREEYLKQPKVRPLRGVSLWDIELLSFSATRVRFRFDGSVLNFLPTGLYDHDGRQLGILPPRLKDTLTNLSNDLMRAIAAGAKRQQVKRSQAKAIDKMRGPQKFLHLS